MDGSPGKATALAILLDVPSLPCFPPVPTERAGGEGLMPALGRGTVQPLVEAQEVAERRELLGEPLCRGRSRPCVSALWGTRCLSVCVPQASGKSE